MFNISRKIINQIHDRKTSFYSWTKSFILTMHCHYHIIDNRKYRIKNDLLDNCFQRSCCMRLYLAFNYIQHTFFARNRNVLHFLRYFQILFHIFNDKMYSLHILLVSFASQVVHLKQCSIRYFCASKREIALKQKTLNFKLLFVVEIIIGHVYRIAYFEFSTIWMKYILRVYNRYKLSRSKENERFAVWMKAFTSLNDFLTHF